MFRGMRRAKQQLTPEESRAILERGSSGVLAVSGDDGYPYAVPLSYVYQQGKLWFHCAREGHKLDAIRRDGKVSFCVVDQDRVVPSAYTTEFCSVILFGRARILEDEGEIWRAIEALARKYHPTDSDDGRTAAILRERSALCMVEVVPEYITGKEGIELTKARMGRSQT